MEKKDMIVSGDKKISAENKAGDKGFFTDKYGNKIYPAKKDKE